MRQLGLSARSAFTTEDRKEKVFYAKAILAAAVFDAPGGGPAVAPPGQTRQNGSGIGEVQLPY